MSIMIPIQIRFGSEKSRIVLLVISAVCVAAGYFGKNIVAYFKIDFTGLSTVAEALNMWTLSALVLAFALLALFLSFLLSVKAVMRKEL